MIARSGDDITSFLVERSMPGVTTKRMSSLLASNSSHIAEIHLKGVEVPAENVIGGWSYVLNAALDHGRYSIAWAGVSIAQEALDSMVTYSRRRKQGGKYLC